MDSNHLVLNKEKTKISVGRKGEFSLNTKHQIKHTKEHNPYDEFSPKKNYNEWTYYVKITIWHPYMGSPPLPEK